jgi:hypothetical protein
MKKTTIPIKAFSMLVFVAAIATPAFAQNQEDSLKKAAMLEQYIELSKTNENHQLLASLNGEWAWVGHHIWPDTSKKPFEFQGTITRKGIWEDRYFITETSSGGKSKMPWADGKELTFHDMYIEGYDNVRKKFFSATINNESNTGLITLEGSYDPSTRTITYEGESVAHFHKNIAPGTMMQFRDLVKFVDSDHYILEHHESIDGNEIITTELKYTRIRSDK